MATEPKAHEPNNQKKWIVPFGQATIDEAIAIENLAVRIRQSAIGSAAFMNSLENRQSIAERIYRARRMADQIASIDGFSASPVFDILLDLYVNSTPERLVSVSSACIGSACPPTTALRWIKYLEQQELLVRVPDELDKRRIYILLTSRGKSIIEFAISNY